jgi:hypothetical protein
LAELSQGLGIFRSTHPQSIGLAGYRSQPDKHLSQIIGLLWLVFLMIPVGLDELGNP